jgi:hypothetical protein
MRIRRSKPVDNFTIIPNATLRDERLSYCARGVLSELLSRPSGWETNADALSERARRHRGDTVGEGRRALRAAFKELEAAGYLLRRKEKGERGRFVTVLEVFDVPQVGGLGEPDRGTAGGTSASGMSVRGTSASGTSIRSTDVRSTEEEDLFEEDASTTSLPEVPPVAPDVTDGGGGGSDLRSLAVEIAASLDYCGKPPTTKQRKIIEDRLVVFLEAGWSLDELVVHLDLTGQAIRYAPAVYIDRLDPVELSSRRPSPAAPQAFRGGTRGPMPTAADYASATVDTVLFDDRPDTADGGMWERASARARSRTATLDREHTPYSNDTWTAPADPAAAAKIPWCGDLDCDEKSRMRDGVDHNGLPFVYQCEKCHPNNRPW